MELFNTLGGVVSSAYSAIARKNKQAAMNNRLKAIVRSEMSAINRAYIALGKHYYNNHRADASGDEALLCSAVDQAKERIERARERLSREDEQAQTAKAEQLYDEPVNEDIFTAGLKESTLYHPFVAAAQEAEDDLETGEDTLKIPQPQTGTRE